MDGNKEKVTKMIYILGFSENRINIIADAIKRLEKNNMKEDFFKLYFKDKIKIECKGVFEVSRIVPQNITLMQHIGMKGEDIIKVLPHWDSLMHSMINKFPEFDMKIKTKKNIDECNLENMYIKY